METGFPSCRIADRVSLKAAALGGPADSICFPITMLPHLQRRAGGTTGASPPNISGKGAATAGTPGAAGGGTPAGAKGGGPLASRVALVPRP